MENVSGFMALDGQFFRSEEECRAHELALNSAKVLKEKSELIVTFFQSGDLSLISQFPGGLARFLRELMDDELTDVWNQFLLHLFLDTNARLFYEDSVRYDVMLHEATEGYGAVTPREPGEYFLLKTELLFEVASYLLGKGEEEDLQV